MNETVGDILRMLRKEQDVTQEQLASALHISNQSVSKWETGQANPDVTLIPAIAAFFKVSVDTLFAFDRRAPLEEYRSRLARQNLAENPEAAAAHWEELHREYPNDYRVEKELARALCAMGGPEHFERIFGHAVSILRNNRNPAVEQELLLALKGYLGGARPAHRAPAAHRTHRELAAVRGLGEPLGQDEADAICAQYAPAKKTGEQGRRVLIVDDAAFMREAIRGILESSGYEVAGEAANGCEAVEAVSALRADLILMDVAMPVMDGLEATARIVAEHPGIRVVMCSAMAYERVVRDALDCGADAFVVKPFLPERLIRAIAEPVAKC